MRKSIIKMLLAPHEKVMNTYETKMEKYSSDLYLQTLTEVNKRLTNHRRYCAERGIDCGKIESGEVFK